VFLKLLAQRALDLAVVLLGVSVIVFLMIRLVPGDAVAIMLGANTEVTPERVAELRARLGLDRPLVAQYLAWAGAMLSGDFGRSIWTGRPVIEEIASQIGPTLQLTTMALVLGAGLALPAGVVMARLRGRGVDAALRLVTVAGLTIPSFWLGIVALIVLAEWAPGLAALGHVPFAQDPLGSFARLALPAITLALPVLAQLSRLVRTAMLDALTQDFVRTARAKGLTEAHVVYGHALRNALIPFVTQFGILTGYLLGGAIVIEQVFAIPGLGRLILGAIAERNYPLLQAAILIVTTGFVLVNFLVDLAVAWLDPRVRP